MRIRVSHIFTYLFSYVKFADLLTDTIPSIDDDSTVYLGDTRMRDPDALPPGTVIEAIANTVFRSLLALTHGNAVYAFKAATLTSSIDLIHEERYR